MKTIQTNMEVADQQFEFLRGFAVWRDVAVTIALQWAQKWHDPATNLIGLGLYESKPVTIFA
ncbi:hypothetical protein BJF93_05705 [Xaviernesmea oryzae]|uniref:Uncharacterized protein n=1 Tax=Xaviernesmea oryzae TaxID=464029 RepID=A0A1Q9ARS9_9HYPH|nr:hypothetical protein BJF93_05705 [Xaviernesmea oryzae]